MKAKQIVDRLLEAQGSITVGEIFNVLPKGVPDQIMAILNSPADDIEQTNQIKAILRQHEKALAAIGLIPDYAAYMMLYAAQQIRKRQNRPELN